jgi:glycosyltransferase involved in cell wall biosynthesis
MGIEVLDIDLQTKKKLKVSIGMPVYNGGNFIREAIDSLLAQTFTDFELIISDNASTDGTEAIAREYATRDFRVHYVRQDENMGGEANFKYVLNKAVGEYFMWAGADDVWDIDWIERLMEAYRQDVALTFGKAVAIDQTGIITRSCGDLEFSGGLVRRSMRFVYQDEYEGKANLIYGLFRTAMIRKILETSSIGPELFSDVLLVFDILQCGEIVTVCDTKLYKRQGGLSAEMAESFSILQYMTAYYLFSYYLSYAKRAKYRLVRVITIVSIPLLFMKANYHRVKRIILRNIKKID